MVRDVPAVLQRPHHLGVNLVRPAQCLTMPGVIRGDFSFATDLSGAGIDGREGVGALVGIRSNHDHMTVLSIDWDSLGWTSGGQF